MNKVKLVTMPIEDALSYSVGCVVEARKVSRGRSKVDSINFAAWPDSAAILLSALRSLPFREQTVLKKNVTWASVVKPHKGRQFYLGNAVAAADSVIRSLQTVRVSQKDNNVFIGAMEDASTSLVDLRAALVIK